MRSYKNFKNQLLRDKNVKKEYEKLGPEFDLVQMIIEKRIKKGLTQADLAKKLDTQQSAIARLESGNYNPSLFFLRKLAEALDAKIKISIC